MKYGKPAKEPKKKNKSEKEHPERGEKKTDSRENSDGIRFSMSTPSPPPACAALPSAASCIFTVCT